jgi:hypothetical protein
MNWNVVTNAWIGRACSLYKYPHNYYYCYMNYFIEIGFVVVFLIYIVIVQLCSDYSTIGWYGYSLDK